MDFRSYEMAMQDRMCSLQDTINKSERRLREETAAVEVSYPGCSKGRICSPSGMMQGGHNESLITFIVHDEMNGACFMQCLHRNRGLQKGEKKTRL